MEILLSNEANIHDHPLYETPRVHLLSTEMDLQPKQKYLITDPFAFDFFLRCVYRVLRTKGTTCKATVDARHRPSDFRRNVLVHFKLLYPELEILGDEANAYISEQIEQIRSTGTIPPYVLQHWRTAVEYPTDVYARITPETVVVTGCSFSYGTGLNCPEVERYDVLLGQQLGRPVANLSYPGSSLEYAANTLRQAPLSKDNVVVWQLTGILRWITHTVEAYPESLPGVIFDTPIHDMEFFDNSATLAAAKKKYVKTNMRILFETLDYLRGVGCKLVVLDPDNFNVPLKIAERVRVETVDYGNDYTEVDGKMIFSHPGPATHRAYADAVIQKLHDLYGIHQAQDLERLGVV